MIDRILDLVNERWEAWLGDMPKPTSFSVLLQSRSRVSVFLFAQGAQAPLLVAKISRDSHDAQDVRHEWETVTRVRNALNGPLRDTLPQPLCLENVGGRTVMFETFMPGRVMPLHIGRCKMRHYQAHLQALYRWLQAFQTQTAHPMPPCLSSHRISRACQQASLSRTIADTLCGLADELDDVAIPRVIAHGDLHPTNILLHHGRVAAIIDWEFSQATQWPFFDWFQFLFEYNYELNKKEKGAAHQEWITAAITDMFSPSSARARAAQPLTTSLFTSYGLSVRWVPLFFTLYLLDFYWPEDRSALLRLALPVAFQPPSLYSGGAL